MSESKEKMMSKSLFAAVLMLVPVSGLDITLDSFKCDQDRPVYATSLSMKCNGSPRCTFGSNAVIYGDFVFNGLVDAGVDDGILYGTSNLQLMTLEYNLFNDLPLNMCGKWTLGSSGNRRRRRHRRLADNADGAAGDADGAADDGAADDANNNDAAAGDANNGAAAFDDDVQRDDQCPEDGQYTFQVSYTLPENNAKTSWLATGWSGAGEISLNAEQNNVESLMGYCTIKFKTGVTTSAESKYTMPSALVASLVSILLVGLLVILCVYCTCCRRGDRRPRNTKYLDNDPIDLARSNTEAESKEEYQNMDNKSWTDTITKKVWA